MDARERELPPEYAARLRQWRQRFGILVYGRVTGLTTDDGLRRFLADPTGQLAAFERAFAEYELRQEAFWHSGADCRWFAGAAASDSAGVSAQIEQALMMLGVPPGASHADIRRAYRRRAKLLHPDWQGERYAAEMVALNEAYDLVCAQYRAAEAAHRSKRHES